jgi:hypothetical protein
VGSAVQGKLKSYLYLNPLPREDAMHRLTIILATLLVLTGSAVAFAAIPSADGTIYGCRESRTGAVIVIDKEAGKTCPSGWVALSWNQKGQPGPIGPPGPAGTMGPQGPAGPVQTLETFYAAGPSSSTSSTVNCPAGYQVTGGGYRVLKTAQSVVLPVTEDITSRPIGGTDTPTGWEVAASTTGAATYEVKSYVVCARLVPAS